MGSPGARKVPWQPGTRKTPRQPGPARRRQPVWTGALSVLPSPAPAHPEGVRFTPEQADEVIAAISDALAGSELTMDELTEAIADRTGRWAIEATMKRPAALAALVPAHERGRAPRSAVLRTGPQPQGDLHQPAPLAARLPPRRRRRGLARTGPATCTPTARPGHSNSPGGSASRRGTPRSWPGSGAGRAGRRAGLDRGRRHQDTARPHRGIRLLPYFDAYVVAGQPRERLYPGAAAARALTRRARLGTIRCCSWSVVGGVWHQRRSGRKLAITVEPLGELTAPQRRQLDDEAGLVGAVMEATATLSVRAP